MADKLRVVLCALNTRYTHTALAPRYLRAALKRVGLSDVSCALVEGTVNEPLAEVLARVEAEAPDLLACSCYIWNVEHMLELANAYKASHPHASVVFGGPEVSYRPSELLLRHSFVDFILSGEGETSFPALAEALLGRRALEDVPSLSYRMIDGSVHVGESCVLNEDPPDPYADTDPSALRGRIVYLESSRGCPYRCTFCLSGRCGGVRYFDPSRVRASMLYLSSCRPSVIKFVDRTFNADRAYAHATWQWIADSYGKEIPNRTRFHFEIAGERLDEASFAVLSRMPVGAIQLEVGLQSFRSETLRAIHRNPNTERLECNIRRLMALKTIHVHVDLIAGLPGEGYDSFVRGFDRAYRLGAHMLQLGFLKLLPGAPMREAGEDHYDCIYSPDPPYEVLETEDISAAELDMLRTAEDALERLYNSGRFRRTLGYLTETCGISPYRLFYGFGLYVRESCVSRGLDPYTEAFVAYASSLPGVSEEALLDFMVRDRLATNSSGLIPSRLRTFDKRLKYVRNALNLDPARAETPGIRRTLALLRDGDTVIYADYKNPDPITGEYTVFECSLTAVLSAGEVT